MIIFFRDVCTKDVGLKLMSLALSILIYVTVSIFAVGTPQRSLSSLALPLDVKEISGVPVQPISTAADARQFKLNPPVVVVMLQGDPKVLTKLEKADLKALVDVTGTETAKDTLRRVDLILPAGLAQVRIVPTQVQVIPPRR